MQTRVLTLRFDELLEQMDDTPLKELIKDKDVITIREHFFIQNQRAYMAVFVQYRRPEIAAMPEKTENSKPKPNWREQVMEADWPLFSTLREWRTERCAAEGVPPYIIFTNQQLADITAARPQSLNQLAAIQGIGQKKIEKYGADILGFVKKSAGDGSMATVKK